MITRQLILLTLLSLIYSNVINYPKTKNSIKTFSDLEYILPIASPDLMNVKPELIEYYTNRTGESCVIFVNNKNGELTIIKYGKDSVNLDKIESKFNSYIVIKPTSFQKGDYIFGYDFWSHSIIVFKNEKFLIKIDVDYNHDQFKNNKASFFFIKDYIIFQEKDVGTILLKFIDQNKIKIMKKWAPNELATFSQPTTYMSSKLGEELLIINVDGKLKIYKVSDKGFEYLASYNDMVDYYISMSSRMFALKGSTIFEYSQETKNFVIKFVDLDVKINGLYRLNDNVILAYNTKEVINIDITTKQITKIKIISVISSDVVTNSVQSFAVFESCAVSFENIIFDDMTFVNRVNFYNLKEKKAQLFLY